MGGASGSDQLSALREEIRKVGKSTRCWRWASLPLCVPTVRIAVGSPAVFLATWRFFPRLSFGALVNDLSLTALLFGCVLSLLVAPIYRGLRSIRLRRRLAVVPPDQLSGLLLPLLSDPARDTRKLAGALLRDFGVPAEVSPATAPGARGDEVSPADGAP